MPDINKKRLARNLSQVKQLDSSVTLQTYYSLIKPFLFGVGNTASIADGNFPSGGIYEKASNSGIMTPSGTIYFKQAGKNADNYNIANVKNIEFIVGSQPVVDEDGNKTPPKYPGSKHFFPSDLVRVLTGLARIFYNGETKNGISYQYNSDELAAFAKDPKDLTFVKKWGKADTAPELKRIDVGFFYEENFELYHAGDVKKLLLAVVEAARQYEKSDIKLDTTNFEPKSDIQKKLITDIVPKILTKYEDFQEKIVKYKDYQKELDEKLKEERRGAGLPEEPPIERDDQEEEKKFKKATEEIIKEITKILEDQQNDFFSPLFSAVSPNNLQSFVEQKIHDKNRGSFLFKNRGDDIPGIVESKEYLDEFVDDAIKKFLEINEKNLTQKLIDPLFAQEKKDKEEADSTAEEDDRDGEIEEDAVSITQVTSVDELRVYFLSDLVLQSYSVFTNEFLLNNQEELIKNLFRKHQSEFETHYQEPVLDELRIKINNEITSNFSLSQEDQTLLAEQGLYSNIDDNEKIDETIIESEWYEKLIQDSLSRIRSFSSPDNEYSTYFEYLSAQFVLPALDILEGITEEEKQAVEEVVVTETTEETPKSAAVPTDIPSITPTQKITQTSQRDIGTLTPEEVRSLQYESAWMYNRAIYELFTAHGLNESDIDPSLLRELQAGVFNYTAGMNKDDLNLLFASASQRHKALLKFYQEFNRTNGPTLDRFYSELQKKPIWNTLSLQQKETLASQTRTLLVSTTLLNPEELLNKSLKESTNIDNPVLSKNIQNTVDSWVLQYGINQPYFAFDTDTQTITEFPGDNPHDARWFINSLSNQKLELILGLTPGTLSNNPQLALSFKQILNNYAQYSFSAKSLHTKDINLRKGLVRISEEDANLIEAGNEPIITKHLGYTNNLRKVVKDRGANTVAGAIDEKKGSNRKESLKNKYKTFLPLWNQLSGKEQAAIYEKFNIPIPPEFLSNGKLDKKKLEISKLEFKPELVGFDISDLKIIRRIIKNKKLSEEKKELILELIAIKDQLAKEEALAEFLNSYQDYSLDESQINTISEMVGVSRESLSTNASYRERFGAQQSLYQSESGQTSGRQSRTSYLDRVRNSRFGKRFGGRLKEKVDPLKLGGDALKSAAGNALSKVAAAGANLIVPGAGVALMAIRNRKLRNILSGAILGGIAFIISKTIYALGSIGGAIGGAIGGLIGGVVSGGTMVIPGVIVGANIGNAILPQRWTGSVLGNNNVAQAGSTAQTTAVFTAPNEATFSATSIGLMAPFGAIALMIFITLYTILIIQGAFLIPVPQERLDIGFSNVGNIGDFDIESCDDFGKPLPFGKNTDFPLAARAFDIVNELRPGFWCYWNWNPNYDGLSTDFNTVDTSESPDLFDEVLFGTHPNHCVYSPTNPTNCTGDYRNFQTGSELYWCTWLVRHTYQENYSLGAAAMADQFRTWPGHIFMPVDSVTVNDIKPGDTIFVKVPTKTRIGHVAVVHSVGQDFVYSVDSNAYSRYNKFSVSVDGRIQDTPYFEVVGFGRRL